MDLDLGPVISAGQRQRILAMLARAEASGAKILAQGQIAPGVPERGFYVGRRFIRVDRGSEIAREEVFGPVLAAMPFDDEADAVRLANGTEYGLVAACGGRGPRSACREVGSARSS